jgi:flavodoxin/NAD-dependent dihydropyrimidine dehydrogenase PreA subunit
MKCLIFYHSATGNTRQLVDYAQGWLQGRGHECLTHDVLSNSAPPEPADVDLLGLAGPTHFFQPSYALKRFVARLTPLPSAKPAFIMATAAGSSGCFKSMLAEQLALKNVVTLGANFTVMPSSWPPYRAMLEPLRAMEWLGEALAEEPPWLNWLAATPWPDLRTPARAGVAELELFLDDILDQASSAFLNDSPSPQSLEDQPLVWQVAGRLWTSRGMRARAEIRIDPERCLRCGTCIATCPAGCLSWTNNDQCLKVGTNCVGCWACYNNCAHGAMSGWKAANGKGRYRGPATRVRAILSPRSV